MHPPFPPIYYELQITNSIYYKFYKQKNDDVPAHGQVAKGYLGRYARR